MSSIKNTLNLKKKKKKKRVVIDNNQNNYVITYRFALCCFRIHVSKIKELVKLVPVFVNDPDKENLIIYLSLGGKIVHCTL